MSTRASSGTAAALSAASAAVPSANLRSATQRLLVLELELVLELVFANLRSATQRLLELELELANLCSAT